MEYTLDTVLTEGDFTIDPRVCNINELVENARIILSNNGHCYNIKCHKCFLNAPISNNLCFEINKYNDHFAIQEEYARQFIRLFDKPKTHHINFMEE